MEGMCAGVNSTHPSSGAGSREGDGDRRALATVCPARRPLDTRACREGASSYPPSIGSSLLPSFHEGRSVRW